MKASNLARIIIKNHLVCSLPTCASSIHLARKFNTEKMVNVNDLAYRYQTGSIDGNALAKMVEMNELSKGDRRKIVKMAAAQKKLDNLTDRQKLRLAVKEKKALPKLTSEDRRLKYQKDLETDREKEEANFTICLGCRKRGHFLKDCKKAPVVPLAEECNTTQICYNCGSNDHALRNCPEKRTGQLKFASCFICKKTGHISRDCPDNVNGLYPNGGCCHICLLKTHLVKDCPQKPLEKTEHIAAHDGVIVKGVTKADKYAGAEEIAFDEDEQQYNEEDEDEQPKKKHKKDKKDKKSKK